MIPSTLADARGRILRDLRISVTDRCNFRCTYCMPKAMFGDDYPFLPREQLLSFEEIVRVARIFAGLGVRKIRLTGGEPLLRRDIDRLVAQLAAIPGIELAMTTNGVLLPQRAQALKAAGLHRITVSLDALDDGIFQRINDVGFPVARVLDGIAAAEAAGFAPLKINMVVRRGVNDREIVPMAERFRGSGHILRFIEYMDVGASNGWNLSEVVPSAEVIERIAAAFPLEPVSAHDATQVAERWRYRDGGGEIGVISSVTQAFCKDCSRLRLSTEGKLFTCLFAQDGHDLREALRRGGPDGDIAAAISGVWTRREDRYSELRGTQTAGLKKIEMSYIGG